MENVDQCNDCKDQQNCQNDANDEPYINRSLNRLENCLENIFGDLNPLNELHACGNVILCLSLARVAYAVNDPSLGVFSSSDEQLNLCQECAFVNTCSSQNVTVGQNESTVFAALNLCESQACGSVCKSGQVGCIQRAACGNGNNDFLDIAVIAGLLVAVLIGVSQADCFVGDLNDYVGSGHYKFVVVYSYRFAHGRAINGFVNVDLCVVTDLVGYGNGDGIACFCIGYVNDCITVGIYVVVANVLFTVKFCNIAVQESELDECAVVVDIICKVGLLCKLVGSGGVPLVACCLAVDEVFELCNRAISQLNNGVLERLSKLNLCTVNVELYFDFGYAVVYPEQVQVTTNIERGCDILSTVPVPAVFFCITCGALYSVHIKLVEERVGLGQVVLKLTVYIVANGIDRSLCIVLNGSRCCGHCPFELACGVVNAVDLCSNVLVALLCLCLDGCGNNSACLVPVTVSAVYFFEILIGESLYFCNRTTQIKNGIGILEIRCGIENEVILVNESKVREVRSINGDLACAYCQTVALTCDQSFSFVNGVAVFISGSNGS